MRLNLRRWLGSAVCLSVALLVGAAPLAAQDVPDTELERAELQEMLQLVPAQQKVRAELLIKKYPNSRTARIAQRLLDEYAIYERQALQGYAAREPWNRFVREFWSPRLDHIIAPWEPPTVRIANETREPVVYQAMFPSMKFVGPYWLGAGQQLVVYRPVVIRYSVGGTLQTAELSPGQSYAFRTGADGQVQLGPASPPAVNAPPVPGIDNAAPPADGENLIPPALQAPPAEPPLP